MKIDIGEDEEEVWHRYLSELRACRDRLWQMNLRSYGNLFPTFWKTLMFLDEKPSEDLLGFRTKRTFSEMHRRLCVLQKQDIIPTTTLRYLWNAESVDHAELIATTFVEMGLASRDAVIVDNDIGWGLSLHDSLHDFAVFEAERHGETEEAHESLLAGYISCNPQLSSAVGSTKTWWYLQLIEDGYIHQNLCRHLLRAGRGRELVSLLMTPLWTARQLKVNGILILEIDFSLGIRAIQERASYSIADEGFEVEETLELICEAAKLSWTFVAGNHRELWFQIYGRLIGLANRFKGIEVYLNKLRREAEGSWLECRNCVLMAPAATAPSGMNVTSVGVWSNCMVLLGDGERVACGCWNGRIIVVNVKREEIEQQWKAHNGEVRDITIGREGRRLVSCSSDRTAKVWDIESRRCMTTFKGHTAGVNCVAVMKDGVRIVSGSDDGTAQVWDMETGQVMSEPFRDHKSAVQCVAVVGNEECVVTGGRDCRLWLWSATSGVSMGRPFMGHKKIVTKAVASMDQCRIVSGSLDGRVRIWDIGSRAQIGEPFKGYDQRIDSSRIFGNIAASRDGRRIAYGSNDNSIRVWDAMTRREVCTPLKGHTGCVTDVSFLNDFESVVSCSKDGSVRVWDVRRENVERIGNRHDGPVSSLSFTPDGKFLVSSSYDYTLRIWDANLGRQVGKPLLGHQSSVNAVAVTPDGRRIVSVSSDGTVFVWDLQSKELLHTLTGHTDSIECVAITLNGNRAVTGSSDRTARVWDLTTLNGSHVVFKGHMFEVRRVFVSNDGKRAISVDFHRNVFVWELETGQKIKKLCQEAGLTPWRLSRRDMMNLVGEPKMDVDVVPPISFWENRITYREEQGELILATMEGYIRCLTVSPDKKTVCVGLYDGQVVFMTLEK